MKPSLQVKLNQSCSILIFVKLVILLNQSNAQWLDCQGINSTNLTLTSVSNSDDEEKDISSGDLNNEGWTDVIVVRKEPFSNPT